MSSLYYQNSRSEIVDFIKDIHLTDISELYSYSYSNLSDNNVIKKLYRGITDFKIKGDIYSQKYDSCQEKFDYDVIHNEKGRFYIGEYYMQCFITSMAPQDVYFKKFIHNHTLTVTTDTPYWIKETRFSFVKSLEIKTEGFTYPFEYPFTYGNATGTSSFTNDSIKDSNFKMIIYGPVSNPSVSVNGNIYTVNTEVLASEYLVIDSTNRKAYKVGMNGEKTNVFSKRGLDFDIFTKIPSGRNTIQWSGAFGFDLYIYDERSKPKWISSIQEMI